MSRESLTIVDCTLRDGGYHTNWEFGRSLVEEYLAVCPRLGIDVVELGYVRFTANRAGPYGQLPKGLTANLRTALPTDHRLRFAAMVDAEDFACVPGAEAGRRLAEKLATGALPVDVVRIAVRYDKMAAVAEAVAAVRDAGFRVCLNLMQIDLASTREVVQCLAATRDMGSLEALYLADSLGSLTPARTIELVSAFCAGQAAPVGIHAHDNQGLALHNTQVAIETGARWVDGTVHGMGRGAGNTRTEQLLVLLGSGPDELQPLLDLIVRHFHPLMEDYRWGASGLYVLAGLHRIHPTYVQRIERNATLGPEEKLRAMAFLAGSAAHRFTVDTLDYALGSIRD
ncbi:hypothetical protein [Amycolatopsis orientalis]|nr:hypothetical protein [Amycolatopsis orientalis]